jgi:ABC-type molybdate transport system substrate-binding protein
MSRNLIFALLLIFTLIIGVYADIPLISGSDPVNLTIIVPYDQALNSGLKTIAKEYGNDHNTIVNIISVQGRKKIVDELTSGNTSSDLVIIEKEYPLYNLSGLKKLENKGLIDKSQEIYQAEADLIVPPDSKIKSINNLNGTKYAAVDLVNYHMPGGCLANYVIDMIPGNITVVNESSISTIFEAVANSSADETVLWKSDYDSQKHNGTLVAIPLLEYGMDNYIATLKNSKNLAEAESFMDFVISHKDELTNQ